MNTKTSKSSLNKSSSFLNTLIGGLQYSKSSTNVNSISGNIADSTASILNITAAVTASSNNNNNNNKSTESSSNGFNSKMLKITKSISSFTIKENQLNDQQKQFKKLITTAPSPSLLETKSTTTSGKMSTSLMDTTSSNNSSSSKIKLPSFNNSFTKKLKSKFSIRKSHSTAANLSDIAKLKISSSTTQIQTGNNDNNSSAYILNNNNNNKNGLNYLQYKKSEKSNTMNYRNSISFIDTESTRRINNNNNNISLDDTDIYLTNQYYQNNNNNNNHHSYYHSFIDNGFTAIQEEQLPNNNLIETNNNNELLIIKNGIHPSSSTSSSLSLTNTINNGNTMSHTLTNSVSNTNSKTNNNYGSSTSSNATTATTTSNSLASSDMASNTSTSSPHNTNLIMPINLEYQNNHQQSHNSSNNKNTPSKHSIGSLFSSISSSFSLSSSSSNTNQVKLRVHKSKSAKSETQQNRISLPASILHNHHHHHHNNNDLDLNDYYKNTTPPLAECDEHILTNENSSVTSTNSNNDNNEVTTSITTHKNKILNNNLNVRNNEQMFTNNNKNYYLTKNGYTSNNHLNMYIKNNPKINNSFSINQLNNVNNSNGNNNIINNNYMQSYQSMSAIAMNGASTMVIKQKNPIIMMKPLNRNSRRASMSELGYGKIESYNKLDKLGEGTYATVFKGQSTINGSFVALKEIRLEHEEGAPCTAIREVSLLRQLKHANIVTLHDIIYTNKSLTLVFEYLEKDLKQYMDDCNNIMSLKNVKLFLFQLLRGLAYCHARQILHRDLKPQNLLINQKGELKLADFGLARAKSIPTKTYSNEVVTLWYRPPDVLLGSTDYSTHIDMWGVGCIFYETVCGKPLFPGTKVEDELYLIFKTLGTPNEQTFPGVTTNSEFLALNLPKFPLLDSTNYSTLAPRLDADGISLLASYLKYNPKERVSAAESMHHRFFSTLPPGVFKLENNQSIFDEPSVTLTKDPGVKLNNAAIRNSTSSYYKF